MNAYIDSIMAASYGCVAIVAVIYLVITGFVLYLLPVFLHNFHFSNLEDGQQKLVMGKKELLKRGVSITDACLGWEQTEKSLLQAYEQLQLAK